MVEGWSSLKPTGLMNPRVFPGCTGTGQSLATTDEILSSGCPLRPALPLGGWLGRLPGPSPGWAGPGSRCLACERANA
eukprot:8408412-Heterocapsa_arctica.AAC.1